jgi:RNA polymerase sigma-70 factor, ECF subfamily
MAAAPEDRMELFTAGLPSKPVKDLSVPDVGDNALVRAARDGDRSAFGQLYERYARMVHGVLLAKVPVDVVDDLVQDVFMQALRRLATLRKTESFGAWLAAIARNRANDHYRQSPREEQLEEGLQDDGFTDRSVGRSSSIVSSTIESSSIEDQRHAAAMLDIVRSLPDAYRETLILRLVEGMTGPEIALRTGLTHGSVRVNLHRGMQMLRAKLGTRANGEPQEETL